MPDIQRSRSLRLMLRLWVGRCLPPHTLGPLVPLHDPAPLGHGRRPDFQHRTVFPQRSPKIAVSGGVVFLSRSLRPCVRWVDALPPRPPPPPPRPGAPFEPAGARGACTRSPVPPAKTNSRTALCSAQSLPVSRSHAVHAELRPVSGTEKRPLGHMLRHENFRLSANVLQLPEGDY